MRLYFAGYSLNKPFEGKTEATHLLESYLYFKDKDYRRWHKENGFEGRTLFLDSGAFSAFSLGVKIDLQGYCDYIKKYEDMIGVYATLDVIGDYIMTRKNTEVMEEQGLKPLPTFHYGSPREELERMIKKYKYIALGGLVPLSMEKEKLRVWLDYCFGIIRDNCKVHGFGVNSFWAWKRYPFYSVDATSWLTGGKFRRQIKFTGNDLVSANRRSEVSVMKYRCFTEHYVTLNASNITEYAKAAAYITRVWESRGIRWKDGEE